jgi:hypothetical protein
MNILLKFQWNKIKVEVKTRIVNVSQQFWILIYIVYTHNSCADTHVAH